MFSVRLITLLQLICMHTRLSESCSQPCGGGTYRRTVYENTISSSGYGRPSHTVYEACNTFCYHDHPYSGGSCRCPSWRTGRCCQTCRNIYIAHCKSGRQSCGGSPDNIRCTECENPYYSGGYGKGCLACQGIANCNHRRCTTPSNTRCSKCYDDNVFFKRTTGDTKCDRLCAWNNHYCWPGKCGDGLTKNCKCDSGFKLVNDNGETSCQPAKEPAIETCLTTFIGFKGKKKQSTSSSTSTACEYLHDVYGNVQLTAIQYDMLAELTIHLSNVTKPSFIKESNFGVTDVTIVLKNNPVSGKDAEIEREILLSDKSSSTHAKQTFANRGNISTSDAKFNLQNGEWLCVHYECHGGGYLTSINTRGSTHVEMAPTPYQKTKTTKTICYRYDDAAPVHCKALNTCTGEPLYVKDRVIRSQEISVYFEDWFDPIPDSGSSSRASSIESYRITVHETIASKDKVQVDTGNVFTKLVNATDTSMNVPLTSDKPMLYCIELEVKDVADNVQQARLFVLYDNSSHIQVDPANPLYVESASVNTNYKWQTHHNEICLQWKDHFFNQFYLDNQVLNAIEPDRLGLISGVYDQIDGLLPVSGTENVHGIVRFEYFWRLNNGTLSNGTDVPNMTNQTYCKQFNMTDGHTYALKIVATDIANNHFEESTTVYIDRTVPHIKNIWLQKGDHRSLFVHDSKELSTMSLYFEALDPHSGILNVNWAFGTTDSGIELLNGTLSPDTLKEDWCSKNMTTCYCPDVGCCEISSYSIPLNKLVSINKNQGDHNRNYYFSIKANNKALLSNIEHVEILVDDSPPETGAVLEGPVDGPDIDYTSVESVTVNWHGFIDHESGIKLYRVALASRCLGNAELIGSNRSEDIVDYAEVPYTVGNIRLNLNTTGKFFVSVVAMNNAMEPSEAKCSDGIVRDVSPPHVQNLTLLHAGWLESIGCLNGEPWLIDESLRKIKLHTTSSCLSKCLNKSDENYILQALPSQRPKQDDRDISDFLCQTLPEFTDENIINIPDDHIYLEWKIDEAQSQMDDYFVGFGRSASEYASPSFIQYTSTNRKTYMKRRHEGIGSDTLFYIFLKTVSKAGLSRVLTIGPVLIDVTPPLKTKLPLVDVLKDEIKVSWDNDTFYDTEQTAPLSHIMFQFATDQGVVSPIHEWRIEVPNGCERCFKYPLRRLQAQDNDIGHDFFVKLFVYNTAGHFLEVNSETFRLPSRYPPGHAFVYDLDPDLNYLETSHKDVDVHYTPNVLCVRWEGFKHHEQMDIEIGVGLEKGLDNIIQCQQTNNTDKGCINSTEIGFDRTYFVSVRAKCSGGETVSSSNGITLVNVSSLLDSLNVRIGKNCEYENPLYMDTIPNDPTGLNVTIRFPLRVGRIYNLKVADQNNDMINPTHFQISSPNVQIRQIHDLVTDSFIPFVPFVESPMFELKLNKSLRNFSSITLSVLQCGEAQGILPSQDQVSIYWYFDKQIPKSFRYEARLSSATKELNGFRPVTAPVLVYDHSKLNYSLTLRTLTLNTSGYYRAEVGICLHECFGPVYSELVRVVTKLPTVTINNAHSQVNVKSTGTCLDISATWSAMIEGSEVLFYTWTVAKDNNASRLLTSWRRMSISNVTAYKVETCLDLPVHAATTMFMCVRGYSNAGTMGQNCSQLIHTANSTFSIDTVYDFDTSMDTWNDIKQVVHSVGIGDKMNIFHDNELNVGTVDSVVGGAIIYATERTVSWYLMKSPRTPTSCKDDGDCIEEIATDDGFVIFSRDKIHPNIKYYICIHANKTSIHREYYEETFSEMTSCSNGFLIDNMAPKAGNIQINNHNGYITSRNVDVSWIDFNDNVDGTLMGYPGNISYYQFKLGNTAGYDDVVKATNTCDRTWAASNADIQDGLTVYVSITAFDHSGQNTTLVSDGYHVDTSPPLIGEVILGNTIVDQLYSSSNNIRLHLRNFKDSESGIDHFEVGIGSSEYNDDIIPTRVYYTDDIDLHLQDNATIEGYRSYIGVTAVNRAGLSSVTKSVSIVFDKSPPIAGQVMDGEWTVKTDADFQSNIDVIHGHWTGFSDQHSTLSYYRVGLGTRPYVDDVKRMVYVGLTEDVSWKGQFVVGEKYYITVEACNGAGLCRQLSSDGIILDNSQPISGLVRVGPDSTHQNYQRHNSSIRIQWTGFEDPQSGIERFEACIGEKPFLCDIVPIFSCLLQSSIIKTGINIPLNKELYATVIAYNKVGKNVTQSSDYFIVDDSAPVLVKRPSFLSDNNSSIGLNVQWERSILRVHWEFKDNESPIVRHELSLLTHHEGHTPVEHMEVGNVNEVMINLDGNNWLHNGDTYSVIVTSCNAAGHCTTEQSSDLLIDSTPPFLGGFKPPMTWENYMPVNGTVRCNLFLTWYGFQDEESGIQNYFLTASKFYSGQELTDGIIRVPANNSLAEMAANIPLIQPLTADDVIILTIWAQNAAGLNSTIGRISVNTLLTSKASGDIAYQKGIFEIEKHSCKVHYCNNDCTCAVVGQPCVGGEKVKQCQPLNTTHTGDDAMYQSISVRGGLEQTPQNITSSSACMSGHWTLDDGNFTRDIVRFEWSVGLLDQPIGEGIFDLNTELPWNDVGLHRHFIHCLSTNRTLIHGEKYVIYVRAWYDFDLYLEYESTSLVVDNTAPSIVKGRFVKDSDSSCIKDFDFIDWTDTITACWGGVFSDQQGSIVYYSVSLGTSRTADDQMTTTRVGLNTSITLNNLGLTHGTKYYFTVTAYNDVGIHTTAVSDGFLVDTDNPTAGIVFNTGIHRDEPFQSSNESFSISWHGFIDHYSGIHSYLVALSSENETDMSNITFINTGLQTSYTFHNANLKQGIDYAGIVRAMDSAGHFSELVRSSSKKIDITAPQGFACTNYETVDEIKESRLEGNYKNITFSSQFSKGTLYVIHASVRSNDTHAKVNFVLERFQLRLPLTSNHDGLRQLEYAFISSESGSKAAVLEFESELMIYGSASIRRCSNMIRDDTKALTVRQIGPDSVSVTSLVTDDISSIRKILVGAGSTYGGFQIRALSPLHGVTSGVIHVSVSHATPVYLTAVVENYAGLKSRFHADPIIMDHTPPTIYNVTVRANYSTDLSTTLDDASVIRTEWKIHDDESGIKACYCAIGHYMYSTDVVDLWQSDSLVSCQSPKLNLHHGTMVYVTVRCVNNVELLTEVTSSPLTIVHQPPKADQAKLSFVKLNEEIPNTVIATSETTFIQTNDSHIQFQWSGFSDTSQIKNYQYRLIHKDSLVTDWTSSGQRTMATIVVDGLTSGNMYTAELKAFNDRYGSLVIRSSLLIYKDQPKLTGMPTVITRSDRNLHLDWSGVFVTPQPADIIPRYSLLVGTRPGYNDVADVIDIDEQSRDIIVPASTIVTVDVREVFVSITCYFNTGAKTVYKTSFKM